MTSTDDRLALVSIDGNTVGVATAEGTDVTFPNPDIRWVWVLDARAEPYDTMEVAEVMRRAAAVRKRYILLPESRVATKPSGASSPQESDEVSA